MNYCQFCGNWKYGNYERKQRRELHYNSRPDKEMSGHPATHIVHLQSWAGYSSEFMCDMCAEDGLYALNNKMDRIVSITKI